VIVRCIKLSSLITPEINFLSPCYRKQASLWIQGDIYRSREQERAQKGMAHEKLMC